MTCANCEREARYCLSDPGALPLLFCDHHLPTWLRERGKAGGLPLPVVEVPVEEEPKPPVKTRRKTPA